MPSLPILDVVIGVVFVYLLLALLCSTVNEMLAGLTRRRAQFLDKGLGLIFNDDDTKERFYNTPVVRALAPNDPARPRRQRILDKALGRPDEARPSYIPSEAFALGVRDMLTGRTDSTVDLAAVQKGVSTVKSDDFQRAVTVMLDESRDVASFDALLRKYFDDAMDRVAGWYKRDAQAWCFTLAILMTLAVNADTVKITHMLWTNTTLRALAVEAAAARRDMDLPAELVPMVVYTDGDQPEKGTPVEFSLTPREQDLLAALTGWSADWSDYGRRAAELRASRSPALASGAAAPELSFGDHFWVFLRWLLGLLWRHGLGWIMTAIAVSIGAPFWFDTLKKFMNVRYAGPKPKRADA